MISRRTFLNTLSSLGCGAIAQAFVPRVVFADPACTMNRKVLITIFLSGGPHGPSILVPRGTAASAYQQTNGLVAITNPLVLDSDHGLNPRLVNLHSLYGSGKMAILNGSASPHRTGSHADDVQFFGQAVSTAIGGQYSSTGWMGRFVQHYCGANDAMALISFGGYATPTLARGITPVTVHDLTSSSNLTNRGVQVPLREQQQIEILRQNAGLNTPSFLLMRAAQDQIVANTDIFSQVVANYPNTVQYPVGEFGRALKDIGRLLHSPLINPKHIFIYHPGYDTHSNQLNRLNALLTELDSGIQALVNDIAAAGRSHEVLIQAYGEFGRTHAGLDRDGSDHGDGGVYMLIGDGVLGGVQSPAYTTADFFNNPYVPRKFDFREVLEQVIAHHFGVDPTPVLPEAINRIGLRVMA